MDSPGFKPTASVASSGAGAGAAAKRPRGRPPLSEEEKAKRAAIKAAEKAAKAATKAAEKAEKEAAKAAAPKRPVGRPKKTTATTASVVSDTSTPKPILDTVLPADPVAANAALVAELSALRRRYAALETVYQKEHAALTAIRAAIADC